MDHLLNVTTGLSIVLLVIVLVSVRRAHIRVEYSVSWLIAAGAMLVLSRARPVLDAVRRLIGLPDTPLTLFLLGGRRVPDHVLPLLGHHFSLARRQHRPGAARRHSGVPPPEPQEP